MRIDAALKYATELLSNHSASPRLDAEILLSHYLDKSRSYLFAWPEKEITSTQKSDFEQALTKRKEQYPVAYLTGYQEFWSLTLEVNESVLIKPNILELGTGSGAIALSLALEIVDSKITATDLSSAALKVAQKNSDSYNLNHISFLKSDWFNEIKENNFDLIISNPPYIDPDDEHMQTGIRFEPLSALCAADNGLADLAIIALQALNHLKEGGWLMLEHGYDQGEATTTLLKKAGYNHVACLKDLSGNDRITIGQCL